MSILKICWQIPNFVKYLTGITGTLHDYIRTFVTITQWILRWIRNFSDKIFRENQITFYFIEQTMSVFFKSCLLLDNVERSGRPGKGTDDNIIWRMRFSFLKTKATNPPSEYEVRLAFARQQWLRERASILCYTYIVSLVKSSDSLNYVFFSVWSLKFSWKWLCISQSSDT